MSAENNASTGSSRYLIAGLLVIVGIATGFVTARATGFSSASQSVAIDQPDWLAGLNGEHRQLFDSPAAVGGVPLVHMMNFLDTYNTKFNVPDDRLNAIGTFYGTTVFHGLSDEMWTKYGIADFLVSIGAERSAGGTPSPWRSAPVIMGNAMPQASIESLQARGTTFILCDNALGILSGMLAGKQGLDAQTVYADMKANMLPGVVLVPAMVIAINQAQSAGVSYHRQ